jgi:membrane fusion protein, multidrug efflux system
VQQEIDRPARTGVIEGLPNGNHLPNGGPPSGSKHRGLYWLAGLLFLAVAATAFYLVVQPKMSGQAPTKAGRGGGRGRGFGVVPVTATLAKRGDIGVYISNIATVTPIATVTVKSRVDGQLMEVGFKEGQMVQKGDLLAVIDPRPYQAAVEQNEGQLARDQAILKNALIDLDRYKMIWTQKAIPKQQLDTQEATVLQDQGTVKLDQGQLDSARVNLDYTRITSPITGRVGLRLVDAGNIVHATDTTGLLVITQLQPITVIFSIAEDYVDDVASQLRAGNSLPVDALDRDQLTEIAHGSLLTTDNEIDTTTGTLRLRALFPNTDLKLFPNHFINAKLLVRTLHNATLVPSAAIQRNEQMAYVYTVKPDQTVISQPVEVQTTDGITTAVSGLKPGATVVTDGFDKLQDGSKISIKQGDGGADRQAGSGQAGGAARGKHGAAGGQSAAGGQPAAGGDSTQTTAAPKRHGTSHSQATGKGAAQ